jgi:phosphotriesterase-related protein
MSNVGVLRRSPNIAKDNLLLDDLHLAIREISEFKNMGGRSIADLTNIGLGRNAKSLQAIARRTKLNIIAGCGYYIAKSHPKRLKREDVDEIADKIVSDISSGMDGSDARAGVIGEIGVSSKMDPQEKKVLKAAAAAHLETGCPIMVHLSPPGREGRRVLDLLEDEGVRPEHVALCHLDSQLDLEYDISLARRGCYISYDQFGEQYDDYDGMVFPRDVERVNCVVQIRNKGLLHRLLVSHDIGQKIDLKHFGGTGYDHILRNIVPLLRKRGLTARDVSTLIVTNPRKFFTFAS